MTADSTHVYLFVSKGNEFKMFHSYRVKNFLRLEWKKSVNNPQNAVGVYNDVLLPVTAVYKSKSHWVNEIM